MDKFIEIHGELRSILLDQAKCVVGQKLKFLSSANNIENIEAPVNDHRAMGLVEKTIQTIKNRLAIINEEKSATNSFNIKHELTIFVHQLKICQQKTTKISSFEAHFGRKPNTPLSVIRTLYNCLTSLKRIL